MFQELTAAYVGDPHLLPGFDDILTLLGARLEVAVVKGRKAHCREVLGIGDRVELLIWPKHREFIRFLHENVVCGKVDVLLTNNSGVSIPEGGTAVVEFGFPSVFNHALFDRPFLGHGGFLAFVDTLANTIRQRELADTRPRLEDLSELAK